MSYTFTVGEKGILIADSNGYTDLMEVDVDGFDLLSSFVFMIDATEHMSGVEQRILKVLRVDYSGITYQSIKIVDGIWDIDSIRTNLIRVLGYYVLRVSCTACEVMLAFECSRLEYCGVVSSRRRRNEAPVLHTLHTIIAAR